MTSPTTTTRRPTRPDEDTILSAAAGGDRVAFELLYDRFHGRVFGLARSVIRDPDQARDVTQDVFLEIWRKAPQFDSSRGSAAQWILRLTHSRAVDRIRSIELSRARTSQWAVRQHEPPRDLVVESTLLGIDQQVVRTAIAALSPIQREAIVLAYFRGLTSSQIGQAVGAPVGTVKSRIRDGLIKLREHLAEWSEQSGDVTRPSLG